jgi:predicted Zn-dependent peptidase
VTAADLQLSLVKIRSGLYDALGGNFGIGKINLLACFALFDDNPSKINALESEFKKITPELIHKTAKQYLRPTNRTILIIEPKAPK